MENNNSQVPGPILLFGSGETLASSGKAYEHLAKSIDDALRISILETPAGFQPNSEKVARNVGDFLMKRLQNYRPKTNIIPARHKDSPFSPDDEQLLSPLLTSNWIFMGPGSPSYAIRQLKDSRAYQYMRALHLNGSALCLASAAVLALSANTLPVYEIYKVGQDLHWIEGLDFLSDFGLNVTFIPHWNNHDGGSELDTSRCFMGSKRFEQLKSLLPENTIIAGIDEQTALLMDFNQTPSCRVFGKGGITIIRGQAEERFMIGETFPMKILGELQTPPFEKPVYKDIWRLAKQANQKVDETPSEQITKLANLRETARSKGNWDEADQLRKQILAEGWQVTDTPEGSQLNRLP